MQHFYYKIEGWFFYAPLYKQAVERVTDSAHFVEVGAWKGKSSSYMAVLIANSQKNIKFDVVDTWKGSPEHKNTPSVLHDTLYSEFLKNMEPVKDYYTPLKTTSVIAASYYEDLSLDFVFIDADHTYESVKEDLLAWLPKVKVGGVIAGDDYPWPGVSRAVNEIIPNNVQLSCGPDEKYCWSHVKQ